jgi:hypothetical protein
MKTFEEYLDKMGHSWNDFDHTYEMEGLIEQYVDERIKQALTIPVVISRLQKIQRFDLAYYRDGEYGIDAERDENDYGDYIDAYEINLLIKDLTNGL